MVNVDHFALNWIPVVVVIAVWNIRVLDNWNCSKRHKRFCSWMYSLVSPSIIAHYVLCLCKMYTLTWMVDSKVEFTVGMLSKRFTSTFCTTTKAPVFMAVSACLPHSLHFDSCWSGSIHDLELSSSWWGPFFDGRYLIEIFLYGYSI